MQMKTFEPKSQLLHLILVDGFCTSDASFVMVKIHDTQKNPKMLCKSHIDR